MTQIREAETKLSLMVVEDNAEALTITVLAIARRFPDIEVYTAENGNAGMETFKKHAPDIVITDINMPGMNGIEMAGEIKLMKSETRLIVIGALYEDYPDKAGDRRFDYHVLKPIDFKRLFFTIEKCIDDISQAHLSRATIC